MTGDGNNGHGKKKEYLDYDDLGPFLKDPNLKRLQERASLGFADSRFMFTLSGISRAVEELATLVRDLPARDLEQWNTFVKDHSKPYKQIFIEITKLAEKKKKGESNQGGRTTT